MIRTSLSPVPSPPPPPPPPLLAVSPTSGGRYDGFGAGSGGGGGGGIRVRGAGGGAGGGSATSPRLPAASNVRMGQADAHALVQRLRGVANRERERRARGTGTAALQEAGRTGVPSEPRVPLEVETALEELRRVAVHGDATTLDVLLSSQVGFVFSEENWARGGIVDIGHSRGSRDRWHRSTLLACVRGSLYYCRPSTCTLHTGGGGVDCPSTPTSTESQQARMCALFPSCWVVARPLESS